MKTTTRNNTKKTGRNGPSIGALAIEALTEAVAYMGGAKTGATV